MEYTENAKMLMGYINDEEITDGDIVDYENGKLELSSSDDEIEDSESSDKQSYNLIDNIREKFSWHEQIRMMQLRSHINQLLDEVKQAQYIADKTREELKKCKMQIKLFEVERDKVFDEIKANESKNNRAAIERLCATHERVCKELEAEQKLETVITDKLDQSEYDLARAELERGKFILAEDDLLQRELNLSQVKAELAESRRQKEQFHIATVEWNRDKANQEAEKAKLEAEKRHRHAVEEAEKSHERANKYLSKTLAKLKKRQEEEAERYKTDMTRKMEMLLKLRADIANNKENLRAIKARDKAHENKEKAAEELERQNILSEGGNPDHALLVKKRKNEMEKMKQQFEANQQVRKVEIVQKILREEENLKKKKKLQPYLWEWPQREKSLRVPARKPKIPKVLKDFIAADDDTNAFNMTVEEKCESMKRLVDVIAVQSTSLSDNEPPLIEYPGQKISLNQLRNKVLPCIVAVDEPDNNVNNFNRSADFEEDILGINESDKNEEDYYGMDEEGEGEEMWEEPIEVVANEEQIEQVQSVTSQPTLIDEMESEPEDEEPQIDLAKPEFEGLWNKQTKPFKQPKSIDQPPQPLGHQGMSKMEEEILKKTLEKTRNGIVTTQVAAGKEFKGPPFYSKPDVIHFKDFEVGKTYKKKVKITNVSYTLNYIKFIDISDKLKDFINIHFDPPGHMSAGLTCDLLVLFKPMINEDLVGKVNFLTQTGPFEIPLICSTKKCNLSVDLETVDFGTHVVGETLKRTVTLTNNGALGTNFDFSKIKVQPIDLPVTKQSSSETNTKIERTTFSAKEVDEEKVENVELVFQSSTASFPDSKSHATVLEKVSESNESISPQANQLGMSNLSSHKLSVSLMTAQTTHNAISQASSVNTALPASGKSPQMLGNSGSGLRDDPVSEQLLQASPLNKDTKTPDPEATIENVPTANNKIVSEINNTTSDTLFKKGLSFQVSKEDNLATESFKAEDLSPMDEMVVGSISCPYLAPFSSVKLEIIWKPKTPGDVKVEFEIKFSDPLSKPLNIVAFGTAIDVPVWVERPCVDLQTCILDRLYQDTIIVCNRASTALRLKFEVAPELKDHMEILPKTGYIQAQSQFSAQLKFLPRKSIYKDAPAFIDKKIGALEAPVTIRVTDQTTPVVFTVQAVVTNSDIELSESNIDFGYCTIHESVVKRIELTNKSILPQQLGFVGLPEWVAVQPNDGFFTLLPLEKLALDVIFSPKKAEEFKFELVCRSLINRDFKISCVGVGVHTPLELSKQVIHFGATTLFDKASTFFYVINNHISANEFANPVPRIGKGKICPVGPTSFQFIVPSDAPITLSPKVGTVQPGKKCKINIKFAPVLTEEEIKEEAMNLSEKEKRKELERLKEKEETAKQTVDHNLPEDGRQTIHSDSSRRKSKFSKVKSDSTKDKNSSGNSSENVKKIANNKFTNVNSVKLDKNAQAMKVNLAAHTFKEDIFQEISLDNVRSSWMDLKLRTDLHANINYNAPSVSGSSSNQNVLQIADELNDIKPERVDSKFYDNYEAESEQEDESSLHGGKTPGKEKSSLNIASQSKLKMSTTSVSVIPEVVNEKLEPQEKNKQSPAYLAASTSLIRQFKGWFQTFTVPCYTTSGKANLPGGLDYSVHNTLYLEVHCPAVKPALLVISDNGKQTLDFGNVSIGQTSQKSITIQNISDKYLELKSTLVNPAGPFLMLNALRPLSPGATHTILMTFTPEKSQIFQERFSIKSQNGTLHLTLKGFGVSPLVNLSFSESVFDMGAVLSGEFVEKVFTIENTSILCIDYIIKQDSLSFNRYNNAQNIPEFLNLPEGVVKNKNFVGTQNYNGKNVFDIVPMRGTIPGGSSQEVTVTFAPDHESDLYSDGVRLELFNEEGSHFFRLMGQGKSRMMYIEGYDLLLPNQESLALSPYYPEEEEPDDSEIPLPIIRKRKDSKAVVPQLPPVLITIKSLMLNDTIQPGSRTLYVGCVRTMAVSQKKNGEFSFEGLQNLTQKGFTVEPQKGMIEAGVKKPVTITWTPPSLHDPNVIIEETATLSLKCDGHEQITLMIQAMVVTG